MLTSISSIGAADGTAGAGAAGAGAVRVTLDSSESISGLFIITTFRSYL